MMLKKYFLFINFALIGLFITSKSCEAAKYFCRCITGVTVTKEKYGRGQTYEKRTFDFDMVSFPMLGDRNDEKACIKLCKKSKDKSKKAYIGAMDKGICKENLCTKHGVEFADGNRNITLFEDSASE